MIINLMTEKVDHMNKFYQYFRYLVIANNKIFRLFIYKIQLYHPKRHILLKQITLKKMLRL